MADRSTSLGQSEQKLCHQPFLTGYEDQSAEMSQMTEVDAGVHNYVANSNVRYAGAMLLRALNVTRRTLKAILCRTGSQCNARSIGVMWSLFLALVTSRAAMFCTRWSLAREVSVMPTGRALQ